MEKGPNFDVVGNISDESKEVIRKDMERTLRGDGHFEKLSNEEREGIERCELEKTAEEKTFINMANDETNMLLKKVGLDPYDFPERNIHIVSGDFYESMSDSRSQAATMVHPQAVVMNKEIINENRIYAALVMFHEVLHMKSRLIYHARMVSDEEEGISHLETAVHINGLEVLSIPDKERTKEGHSHFYGLNEAVTAHEEIRYLQKLIDEPIFAKEREVLFSEKVVACKEIVLEKFGVSPEEIFNIDLDKESYLSVGYGAERKVLDYVCKTVADDNNIFEESVYEEFLKAQFTGKLLPIARLVEASFGKGGFRELGKLKIDKQSAGLVLDGLRELRTQVHS